MEEYRITLQRRRCISIILLIVSLILVVVEIKALLYAESTNSGTYNDGFLLGFQSGLILVVLVKSIIDIVSLTKTIKDEKKIRLLYNKEHDERMQLIYAKSGYPLINTLCIVLILVAVIFGYFNFTIFYTIIVVVGFELAISCALRVYYLRKM